ncbi:unnamed protein product, partial [Echinostoma caproni]|uniref:histidine--tRNA ligase n=1 Tax=Echinostoma caproni TaxID=27848 RepID=A0A183A5M4_9TREM
FTYDPSAPVPTTTSVEAEPEPDTGEQSGKSKSKKSKKSKKNAAPNSESSDPAPGSDHLPVGSVAGGGRYDGLVGMFDPSGARVPCVGVSFGVERLLAIREALATSGANKSGIARATETDVMVVGAHKGLITQRLQFCRRLWDAKIKATMSHKNHPKMLDQLQYCESTGIPLAVVLGDGELSRGVVKLRVIATREEREVSQDAIVDTIHQELAKMQSNGR